MASVLDNYSEPRSERLWLELDVPMVPFCIWKDHQVMQDEDEKVLLMRTSGASSSCTER